MTGVPSDNTPRPAEQGSQNLIARILAALVLVPLAIAAAWHGGWIWFALASLVAIGLFLEWSFIIGLKGRPRAMAAGIVTLYLAGVALLLGRSDLTFAAMGFGAIAVAWLSDDKRGWAVLGLSYSAAALLGSIAVLRDAGQGFIALMLVFGVVWASDIGGYFAGRSIGGPKLWPRISPKKTWAGAVGGFGLSLAVAAGFAVVGKGTILPVLLVGATLSVASQLGDLFESAVKRRFGVKDSSHIIPGHGGLLDRLDGFVAAIVLAALLGFVRGGADGVGRGLMVW